MNNTEAIFNEIFKCLLDKNMAMEINKTNGGQYITIGSDAYVVEDLGADYLVAKSLVDKVGLQEVIYKKRKRIMV